MKSILVMVLAPLMVASVQAQVWPSGGAAEKQLMPGSAVSVKWDDAIRADRVTIELWDGERGVASMVASGVAASQPHYEWVIPADQLTGAMYRFVVRDHTRPSIAMFSKGFLSIVSTQSLVSGIQGESVSIGQVIVEPVPAVDKITVTWELNNTETLEIRDLQGQLRWSGIVSTASTSLDVDVRELSTGMYTLIARTVSGQSITKPFLIQR